MTMRIRFHNLAEQHSELRPRLHAAFDAVIDQSAFAGGCFVSEFEHAFAAYCGTRHAIGVGSGTEALWFALLAAGVGRGDEVITTPLTFIATAEAISFCGATPVFVDIDPATYTIDPARLEAAITSRTKAIVPVHLYGTIAAMESILSVARAHGIPVIEDACQAHGAIHQGRKAGSFGVAGCFSFYPGKNLGALGEAGAVVTDHDTVAAEIRRLRNHGQTRKYVHEAVGWNGRMDGIQAAVLSLKLQGLDAENAARRERARQYSRLLNGLSSVVPPHLPSTGLSAHHLYVIRVAERDEVHAALAARGIECGIHYPSPLHLQQAYANLGHRTGDFPVAERVAAECLSLPLHSSLSADDIAFVVEELATACDAREASCA